MNATYQPVEDGFRIVGSQEIFNRALYGGHAQDDLSERFFTLAGDQPLVMGALTDWRRREDCTMAKCGVLMAGVAMTPGVRIPLFYYSGAQDGDRYSQWLHEAGGTVTTFRPGWLDYEIQPFFQCFPQVKVSLSVLPLLPEAGYLVAIRLWADQRVLLTFAIGGITDFLGRLEYRETSVRGFRPEDCRGNRVTVGDRRGTIVGQHGDQLTTTLRVGTTLPATVDVGDARLVAEGPGAFLRPDAAPGETPVLRLVCPVGPDAECAGVVVVLRNGDEAALDRWLNAADPVGEVRAAIRRKQGVVTVHTPDPMLDLTVPPVILAMDACWHGAACCHGTYAWHTPYMGWRNWYGPTVIGWHARVAGAFRHHVAAQMRADGPEETGYTGPGQYHYLNHTSGCLPEIAELGRHFYNMQEVGVDMYLHQVEWSGDLPDPALFDAIADVLAWEARVLDPDNDGLYQNWLNTWISDAHSYNGGGCAQASAYNYRANRVMAAIARRLGRDPGPFAARAERTAEAIRTRLWLPALGRLAEYVDTIGNCLVHPSPELATIYHGIECGLVDEFQAWTMLRFARTNLRQERTVARGGRLVWSSDWGPQSYSARGLYPAENLHLAWACFRCGLTAEGHDLLTGVVDAHFLGPNPGMAPHCLSGSGFAYGAQDFSEISSLHLRTIVEGVFGLRRDALAEVMTIAPNFPPAWDHARLDLPGFSLSYDRRGPTEDLALTTDWPGRCVLRLPWRGTRLESVLLDGVPTTWRAEPGLGRTDVVVETAGPGLVRLSVRHGGPPPPVVPAPVTVRVGEHLEVTVPGGAIAEVRDPAAALAEVTTDGGHLAARVTGAPGWHTVFLRVRADQFEAWLPADFEVRAAPVNRPTPGPATAFRPVDLSSHYNLTLAEIHQQEYRQPRPAGYSIGMKLNGRFGWDWNQRGCGPVVVEDAALRQAGGVWHSPSGLPFATPASGPNVACVAVWENFPTGLDVPLTGRAHELAILFVAVTNPMQAGVENARFTVAYAAGPPTTVSLVYPRNVDDWLVAAVQTENETAYFSAGNHAIVQRLPLDPGRELAGLRVEAIANEVIIGVLGLALRRG